MIKAKNIYKIYDDIEVLSDISITLKENRSIAIMGASGEGKTTLLHILATLEEPTKGEILIESKYNDKNLIRNRFFGFIFQSYNLLEDFSSLENILMPSMIARNKKKFLKRAKYLLKELKMEKKANTKTKFLSGGEKQRIAIARAFLLDPKIIFADEPTGNLDRKNSEILHKILLDFVKKEKKSLIVATHDEELASKCDEKFILKGGKIQKI